MTNSKISGGQIVILLFLSRVFNALNYAPALNENAEGTSLIYGTLISFVISALVLIPPLLLYKRFHGENIIALLYKRAKPLSIILSIVIFAVVMLNLIGTVVGFEFFMTNAVYPDAIVGVISITMCIACFAASVNGLEGLARAGLIVFVFFMVGTIFICSASIPSIKLLNIKPVLENALGEAFNYGLNLTAKTYELLVFILLLPRIKGNVYKSAFWFLVLTFGFIVVSNFLIMGVLGDFYKFQTFPYYSLASVVEVSVLQRLDSIHMISWVFVSFMRITLQIIIASMLLKSLIPKKVRKLSLSFIFILTIVFSVILGYQTAILKGINLKFPIFILLLVFLLPLIMLFTCKKKGAYDESKEAFTSVSDNH